MTPMPVEIFSEVQTRKGAESLMTKIMRETKAERHGRFVSSLGDRLIWKYTDGGASRTRDKAKARAAKLARKRNR